MTLQEYIDQVRKILDEYNTDISFWTDDELTFWLNEGLKEVSKKAKYLTQRAYIYPTIEETYPLPKDYIDYYKVKLGESFEQPITIEEDGEETGFYIWGDTIFISNYEREGKITLYYYRTANKMEAMIDEAELPVEYEDIIIPFCLYRAFMKDRRTEEAGLAQQEFYQRAELMKRKFARKPSKAKWKVIR
jgi:hypothetical protein